MSLTERGHPCPHERVSANQLAPLSSIRSANRHYSTAIPKVFCITLLALDYFQDN